MIMIWTACVWTYSVLLRLEISKSSTMLRQLTWTLVGSQHSWTLLVQTVKFILSDKKKKLCLFASWHHFLVIFFPLDITWCSFLILKCISWLHHKDVSKLLVCVFLLENVESYSWAVLIISVILLLSCSSPHLLMNCYRLFIISIPLGVVNLSSDWWLPIVDLDCWTDFAQYWFYCEIFLCFCLYKWLVS